MKIVGVVMYFRAAFLRYIIPAQISIIVGSMYIIALQFS